MHVSCNQAGLLLARIGRPEVATCTAALQQYSVAYEEAALQAEEIERIFSQHASVEFMHMAEFMPSKNKLKRDEQESMTCEMNSS